MFQSLISKPMSRHTLGIWITCATAFSFGAYPAAARYVYEAGGNASLALITTTFFRALFLVLASVLQGRRLFSSAQETKIMARSGFFQALSIVSIFTALQYLSGPLVIVIIFTHTLMLLFHSIWRKETAFDLSAVITTLLALGGLSLVLDVWKAQTSSSYFLGIGIAFIGALATFSRLYAFGKQVQTVHPVVVGAENFSFAVLFLLPFVAFFPPVLPVSFEGYAALALASLSSVAGSFGMFYGISLLGSFQFSQLLKLEPCFTALFSVLLLGEVLKMPQYIGLLLVMGSLLTYQYVCHKRDKRAAV